MDPQLIHLYVTLVAGLTGRMRPIFRYPLIFVITLIVFLLGALVTVWFSGGRQKALTSFSWFITTQSGVFILAIIGTIGVFFVWIAFLFNPSDEEAERGAKKVRKTW
jgi:hypothetical protein